MCGQSGPLAAAGTPATPGTQAILGPMSSGYVARHMTGYPTNVQEYLFIFGCAGSSLLLGLFSSFRDRGYSLIVVYGLVIALASLIIPLCWPLAP